MQAFIDICLQGSTMFYYSSQIVKYEQLRIFWYFKLSFFKNLIIWIIYEKKFIIDQKSFTIFAWEWQQFTTKKFTSLKIFSGTLRAPLYDELGTQNFPLYDGAKRTRLTPATQFMPSISRDRA